MKQKYIFEIYDKIIKEIKNPRIVFDNDFIHFHLDCSNESYLIYKVDFIKQQSRVNYEIKDEIHNLHPKFQEIVFAESNSFSEYETLIPQILEDLNLTIYEVELRWSNHGDKETLFVKKQILFEKLSIEMRFFLYCFNTLKNENDKIKKLDKQTIFNFKSRERIEQYIHKKQDALENLANRLIKDINPVNTADLYVFSNFYDKIDCLKVAYIYLEKLLRFIEKEYKNYLNVNIQIPYRSILIKEYELTPKLNAVKSRLLSSNIDEELLKLSYEPLLKIATINIQEKLTYYQFNYCSDYIFALSHQIEKEIISKEIIIEFLFDLNYNSLQFFKYLTFDIVSKLDLLDTNIHKIDFLYRLLKDYNQKQVRCFIKYKQNLPPLKQQICNWIEEEIEYLSKKIKLEANQISITSNTEAKSKLLSGLSVAQLSYFFGLLMDIGIIKHKNHMDVFRFIADNFRTSNSENLSVDSIKSKFYNIETTTKSIIREKIIQLLSIAKF